MIFNITIFTPTYNRAYILDRLYKSLVEQSCHNFEWLIIDDGSTDNTENLIREWLQNDNKFNIRYYKVENGGKQRAINKAVSLAKYDYFFCVDSDDRLIKSAVEQIISWIPSIHNNEDFAAISGLKRVLSGKIAENPKFCGKEYIDCTNLDRIKYNLTGDCAEIYKTKILKKYPFKVWEGETFTPECIVWDAIAIDGYKVRWYNSYIYECEYLLDGLTNGGYRLYAKNLMGCAMANNIKLKTSTSTIEKFHLINEILISLILTKNIGYIKEIEHPVTGYLMLPISIPYAIRRRYLINKFSKI